jgi:NTP pyrophosphatase (non-canonical NTP hydrolase)
MKSNIANKMQNLSLLEIDDQEREGEEKPTRRHPCRKQSNEQSRI